MLESENRNGIGWAMCNGVMKWLAVALVVVTTSAASAGQVPQTQAAGTRSTGTQAVQKKSATKEGHQATRPKLLVLIVVDQMRADYVEKFRQQWYGGLKRLVEEGAWLRAAAYPYAATETCVGHATVSTGAFPNEHGMVANAWWDREQQKMVTCTSDASAQDVGYAGVNVKGGDSAVRMQLPAFAEELKFQTGGGTRVVSLSLKARAAITMAGHRADSVTWIDSATGAWETSSVYGKTPFVEEYAKSHPVSEDYGKTWSLSLPVSEYLYEAKTEGAGQVLGWDPGFPHPLRGKNASAAPDPAFLQQWGTSPFADTALTKLAEAAVDSLSLGRGGGTDFLAVSYSSVDYVGHAFGPRSWEIQDVLVRLDQDLGDLFEYLDEKVGRGKYVVALTADHGVAPIPSDMAGTGTQTGVLLLPDIKDRIEKALENYHYTVPAVAKIAENDIYFSPGTYAKLQQDPAAMHAVIEAIQLAPGVAAVYRSEELASGAYNLQETRNAFALGYFPGRSGDMFVLQRPYWLTGSSGDGSQKYTGTGHGTPYYYDQRVPILMMGYGIRQGEFFEPVTPADIAPTFAALCGITLATNSGHVLGQILQIKDYKGQAKN